MSRPVCSDAPTNLDPALRDRNLRFSVYDGVFYAIMTGLGEGYLGAFAVFLRATNAQVAALLSLPQLIGALFQIVSAHVLYLVRNRKTIILIGVFGQALTWPMIVASGLWTDYRIFWLILWVGLYFVLGNFAHPAWMSLMGDLVHAETRGTFFGRRNRWMSIASFSALGLAGLLLHATERWEAEAVGFITIFLAACTARLISASYLVRMIEPSDVPPPTVLFSLWQFACDVRKSNFGRFVIYTTLTHFAVAISGPLITPYLLRDLGFSYGQFMCSSASVVLAQFLTLSPWGRFCDLFGNRRALTLSGALLTIIPLFWLLTTDFYAILAIQFFAGICWAGFTLSMGNFIFDTVTPPRRALCAAIYSAGNAVGMFAGATLGGLLVQILPNAITLGTFSFSWQSNMTILFFVSMLLRAAVSLTLRSTLKEVRDVRPFQARSFIHILARIAPFPDRLFSSIFNDGKTEKESDAGTETLPASPPSNREAERLYGSGSHDTDPSEPHRIKHGPAWR